MNETMIYVVVAWLIYAICVGGGYAIHTARRNGYLRFRSYYIESAVGADFKVIRTASLAMLDWDIPDMAHQNPMAITIASRNQAMRAIKLYCKEHPEALFVVEKTKGGVHAWLVSKPMPLRQKAVKDEWFALGVELMLDPCYVRLCAKRRGFSTRVSPKPGRVGDRVATYWDTVGTGEFDPKLRKQWHAYLKAISKY